MFSISGVFYFRGFLCLGPLEKSSAASKYALEPNPQLAQLNPNHGTWERIEELVRLMKEPIKSFLFE